MAELPHDHLLRSIRVTCTARFHSARRLRHHEAWSLWSISFASLFLLLISLLEPFDVAISINSNMLALSQVAASAIILVVSILVNGSKFGERAEKMHTCALELNALSREIENAIHAQKLNEVNESLRARYETILGKYENHSDTDFLIAQIRRAPEYYGIHWYHIAWSKIKNYGSYSLYVALLIGEILFIYCLVNPAS